MRLGGRSDCMEEGVGAQAIARSADLRGGSSGQTGHSVATGGWTVSQRSLGERSHQEAESGQRRAQSHMVPSLKAQLGNDKGAGKLHVGQEEVTGPAGL